MREMKRFLIMLSLATTILFVGHSIVSAQDDSMGGNNKTSKDKTPKDKKSKDKMSGDKMSGDNMSSMMSESDTDFAKMAAMGGNAEIAWANVAMQKSNNKMVKKYASKMIKDHTKAGKNLMKVATKHNMTLPTGMSDEQTQMLSQLQQASAADFDKMYIDMSGVDAHQKMQALFQGEASGGSDADLKAFAAKTLPTVQMHLKMAQDMANGRMTGDKMMKNDSMKKDSMK
jgi:putative membrane protein